MWNGMDVEPPLNCAVIDQHQNTPEKEYKENIIFV